MNITYKQNALTPKAFADMRELAGWGVTSIQKGTKGSPPWRVPVKVKRKVDANRDAETGRQQERREKRVKAVMVRSSRRPVAASLVEVL